jgi:hypothetical protein
VPYFLDGNNLIGRERRGARPDEEDRSGLIAELCDRLRRTRARALLFFDGSASGVPKALGPLSIRFSGGLPADEVILREIARSAAPGEIVLVTADRELGVRARDAGAKTLSPAEFWERFGKRAVAPTPEAAAVDVEEWTRYFQDERNRE